MPIFKNVRTMNFFHQKYRQRQQEMNALNSRLIGPAQNSELILQFYIFYLMLRVRLFNREKMAGANTQTPPDLQKVQALWAEAQ